jgi:hypothetical protein
MSTISVCADDAFDLKGYYWKQWRTARDMIESLDAQMKLVTEGPAQYSMDSGQSRFSTMTHRLGELKTAREYWTGQFFDAVRNLQALGEGVDDCCGDTGLTVIIPAF